MNIEQMIGKWLRRRMAGNVTTVLGCKGCGRLREQGDPRRNWPPAEHCWACPPWREDCGHMNSPTTKCACYINV